MHEEPGKRLRVWDRIDHDLVERVVTNETTPCVTLGMTLLVGPIDQYPAGLRLSRELDGKELVLSDRATAEHEGARRQTAEARVAELEREVAASKRKRASR